MTTTLSPALPVERTWSALRAAALVVVIALLAVAAFAIAHTSADEGSAGTPSVSGTHEVGPPQSQGNICIVHGPC